MRSRGYDPPEHPGRIQGRITRAATPSDRGRAARTPFEGPAAAINAARLPPRAREAPASLMGYAVASPALDGVPRHRVVRLWE